MENLKSEPVQLSQNDNIPANQTCSNKVPDTNKPSSVNQNSLPCDSGSENCFYLKSRSESLSCSLSSLSTTFTPRKKSRVSDAAMSLSSQMQSDLDVDGLVSVQKKFKSGERVKSPPRPIPIDCVHPDRSLPAHQIAWIESQQRKARDIIFDDRFHDAIAMVNDGRAQVLVSNGYNMYGEKMKEGMNFFDKPFDHDYGMYDWLPKWVKNSNSQLYYEVKRTLLL